MKNYVSSLDGWELAFSKEKLNNILAGIVDFRKINSTSEVYTGRTTALAAIVSVQMQFCFLKGVNLL